MCKSVCADVYAYLYVCVRARVCMLFACEYVHVVASVGLVIVGVHVWLYQLLSV